MTRPVCADPDCTTPITPPHTHCRTHHPTADLPTLIDVAKAANISYRQATYWSNRGYLQPLAYGGAYRTQQVEKLGSGRLSRLPHAEAEVLHIMARLVRVGITVHVACTLARTAIYHQERIIYLGEGIFVHIPNTATREPA